MGGRERGREKVNRASVHQERVSGNREPRGRQYVVNLITMCVVRSGEKHEHLVSAADPNMCPCRSSQLQPYRRGRLSGPSPWKQNSLPVFLAPAKTFSETCFVGTRFIDQLLSPVLINKFKDYKFKPFCFLGPGKLGKTCLETEHQDIGGILHWWRACLACRDCRFNLKY